MNSIRKLLVFLVAAFALAAFALPAAAQQKIYSLNISSAPPPAAVTVPTVPSGSPATIYATVKNETPNGNSSFNSLVLTAPAGLKINVAGTSTPNGTLSVASDGSSLSVTNMSPVKNLQSVTLTLSVTGTNTGCTSAQLAWSVVPWTGSAPGSGQTFGPAPSPPASWQVYTNVASNGCSYTVTGSTAVVAGDMAAAVALTLNNVSGPAITSITLTPPAGVTIVSPPGGVVSGLNVTAGHSAAINLTVSTSASCTGTGAANWGVSSLVPAGFTGSSTASTSITSGGCTYSLTGASAVTAGQSTSVNLTLANTAPSAGGPPLTSITLTPPAGVTIVGSATVSGLNLGYGSTAQVISVNVKTDPSCVGAGPSAWSVASTVPATYTGTSTATTSITPQTCTLGFVHQPSNALNGAVITDVSFNLPNPPGGNKVTVQAKIDGSPASGIGVSVSSSTACAIQGGGATTTDANGNAVFSLTSNANPSTSCQLTATATTPGFSSPSSNSFKIVYGATGVLGCDFTNNTNTLGGKLDPRADLAFGPGDPVNDNTQWGLIRGPNPDGSDCVPVPYQFTLDTTSNQASFIVPDKFGQAYIAVEYTVVWGPVFVDDYPTTYTPGPNTAGWTQRRPQFAWGAGLNSPPLFPGEYVPGLACVIDNLNAGFGALPFFPKADPFYGSTVGTGQYAYVPSPGAPPSGQALMCVAQQGWTSLGTSGGKTQVLYWNKIIDESDSNVKFP